MKTIKRINDIEDGELDGFIHDLKSQEASSINNRGVKVQIEYLQKCGISDREIIEESKKG